MSTLLFWLKTQFRPTLRAEVSILSCMAFSVYEVIRVACLSLYGA